MCGCVLQSGAWEGGVARGSVEAVNCEAWFYTF